MEQFILRLCNTNVLLPSVDLVELAGAVSRTFVNFATATNLYEMFKFFNFRKT